MWNAQDIVSLQQPLKKLFLHTVGLLDLQINQARSHDKISQVSVTGNVVFFEKFGGHGKHQVTQSLNLLAGMREHGVEHSILESYRALSDASDPLIKACQQAFDALLDSIQQNNSRRWFGKLSPEKFQEMRQRHEAALENLKEERTRYPLGANKALLDTHEHLFDRTGQFKAEQSSLPKLSGLFVGLNFEDRIVRLAESLERPLALVVLLESERTTNRVWFPVGIRKFFSWVFGSTSTPVLQLPTSEGFPEVDKAAMQEMHDKLKSTTRPTKQRSKVTATILGVVHWLSNEDGVYAMRVLIGTMAVAVVAVTTNTAGFFYREKGLWAVIMAQTGLLPHFSDFTFAFIYRVVGTVAGGVLGMLGWYIGSGSGPGNPYGLAAVMAVASPVIMWARLYSPPQHLPTAIMFGATFMLVIGYSYIDS